MPDFRTFPFKGRKINSYFNWLLFTFDNYKTKPIETGNWMEKSEEKRGAGSRQDLLNRVVAAGDAWDLLVIGGGATGLGIALDAVSRGYKTLLLEQADFAKGTSSRSTTLIHGGV